MGQTDRWTDEQQLRIMASGGDYNAAIPHWNDEFLYTNDVKRNNKHDAGDRWQVIISFAYCRHLLTLTT